MIDYPVAVISQEGLAGLRADGIGVIGPPPSAHPRAPIAVDPDFLHRDRNQGD
jgi:hypothetical protein